MSYQAIVTRITNIRPHPNADRLKLGTAAGAQVVIGLDTAEGSIGVYFPTDGQLSHNFCVANNLYTQSARNTLALGEGPTGFFDVKRRVRTQRFRGEQSDGIWLPVSCLHYLGVVERDLPLGMTFAELNGKLVCEKYFTPATLRAMKGGTPKTRREVIMFPKHPDTPQLRFVIDQIPEDALITITEKLHGTSGRYAHVLDELPLSGWQVRLNGLCLRLFGRMPIQPKKAWVHINGSKNVVLETQKEENSYYGTNKFRMDLTKNIKLHKGEAIYFEIVGDVQGAVTYTGDGTGAVKLDAQPIMPIHSTKDLPEIRKAFGDTMRYQYGCPPGTCRMYIYKIIHTNEDGNSVELPWFEVKRRCHELGLQYVPEITRFFRPKLRHIEQVQEAADRWVDGPSLLDATHIREGIVLRVESSSHGVQHVKHKSFAFKVMEGIAKLDDTSVDMEEAS